MKPPPTDIIAGSLQISSKILYCTHVEEVKNMPSSILFLTYHLALSCTTMPFFFQSKVPKTRRKKQQSQPKVYAMPVHKFESTPPLLIWVAKLGKSHNISFYVYKQKHCNSHSIHYHQRSWKIKRIAPQDKNLHLISKGALLDRFSMEQVNGQL